MKHIPANYTPFMQNLVVQGHVRDKAVSMAIACAIATAYIQPQEKLEAPATFYHATHGGTTFDFLGALNNLAPVDYNTISGLVVLFYRLQHTKQHGHEGFAPQTSNAIYDAMGFTTFFSKEEISFMADPMSLFNRHIQTFCMMFKEWNK